MDLPPIGPEFPIVLSSKSPRREELLRAIGIPFLLCPVDAPENRTGLHPIEHSVQLSISKAKKGYELNRGRWVLGADTIVVLGDEILGKPSSREEARETLQKLSGKIHEVITSMAIIDPKGEVAHQEAVLTRVTFKELKEEEIEAYIETGEPMDKAGAYGIQGIGAFMVKRLEGSYSNVVGLPLFELVQALLKIGALRSFPLRSFVYGFRRV